CHLSYYLFCYVITLIILSMCFLPHFFFFFLILRRPPTSTLFPYTTLFRSNHISVAANFFDMGGHSLLAIRLLSEIKKELGTGIRSEEHTSELQSLRHLVCRLLLEKKKKSRYTRPLTLQNSTDSTIILK